MLSATSGAAGRSRDASPTSVISRGGTVAVKSWTPRPPFTEISTAVVPTYAAEGTKHVTVVHSPVPELQLEVVPLNVYYIRIHPIYFIHFLVFIILVLTSCFLTFSASCLLLNLPSAIHSLQL